jgi:hypothetical protein
MNCTHIFAIYRIFSHERLSCCFPAVAGIPAIARMTDVAGVSILLHGIPAHADFLAA